ncbi:peptidase M61 [Subsaxibacter sp. CAU 1640]|uniref:M61 family metallopeptidase n=1 Tax=Subsaxibacter sp. CAU 1640 TaxID=2933271 RepID=UPI00200430B8|nr:peptidase M61 [Subsaxibacter sp. CAU 1640]MCK7591100.1 peptidase M61 [Subsaxibacter sp. CAU 1640]
MKKILSIAFMGALMLGCGSASKVKNDLATSNPIVTSIDITKVSNDKLPVVINPGRFVEETVTYYMPSVVPGTYALGDYGRFIDNFKAIDYNGNELTVTHPDQNTWVIANAKELDKITYYVNDTYDQEVVGGIGGEMPFSPAGTNIEPNNYVLNLYGYLGYFDNLKNAEYSLDVTAPATFKHSSALQSTGVKSSPDGAAITNSYYAPRYFDIMDNPMMYGKLDIEEFLVGDIKIVLSVYSPNKVHSAASLKETVYKMMEAQKKYLGDINSTPRYDIFLYLAAGGEGSPKGFGALEHHKSTTVVLREQSSKEQLAKSMIDVVAHEFFHIVTPLSVHSEDIHYFDYINPTFSKHLWMYEGVTEYFAQHFQVYEGLATNDEFYAEIMSKINISHYFDDEMSFTVMSENIMDEPYSKNYINVYSKGALIGMCIDILMREESNGQRSMLSLMKELSNKYGVDKPFDDDSIIAEITKMTYPSVGAFLQTHVVGTTPINYEDFFKKVGLTMSNSEVETNYIQNSAGFIFDANEEQTHIFFSEGVKDNSFWAEQGVMPGDIVKEINGTEFTIEKAQLLLGSMYQWQPGQDFEVKVERDGKEVVFKGKLAQAYTNKKTLMEDENATAAQIALRKAWLKG